MTKKLNFIDLFAGAGGLSEGFIKAGFEPIAHVEMDEAACFTLRTRAAYHYLHGKKKFEEYIKYLKGEIDRDPIFNQEDSLIFCSMSVVEYPGRYPMVFTSPPLFITSSEPTI